VTVGDLGGAFSSAGARLWVDYSAAYLAESLRSADSDRSGPVALDVVARIARSAGQRTGDRAVTELADLVERANRLRR
jgi:Ca-activated chloride channel family protein